MKIEQLLVYLAITFGIYMLVSKSSSNTVRATIIPPGEPANIGPPPPLRGDSTTDGLGRAFPYGSEIFRRRR